ncbi:MAG: 1,4-dihydroxy-2-naphthoate octaprenyltransferase [Prevotella sp.]|nr:1,4-dihydroxy-2-naphthoate octaprenyltransferase [Prevotella sp.]
MVVDINMRKNSLKAWVLAARPKTLTGAAVPVMIGGAYAWNIVKDVHQMQWVALALCFLFAFLMQIDANFVNDYYDCLKGRDNERRLGPIRACQQGWVTMKAMRYAIIFTSIAACMVGFPLVFWGGWELILVGIACVLFCFLYTTTLAQKGLGDVLVLIFFGIIPVVFTTYVTISSPSFNLQFSIFNFQTFRLLPWNLGVATGLVIDCLLLVNNYRDIENDRHAGKNTLVVMIGKKNTEYLYMALVPIAVIMVLLEFGFSGTNMILGFIIYFLHIETWNKMRRIGEGRALNAVLGQTARNIFVYGVLTTVIILLANS